MLGDQMVEIISQARGVKTNHNVSLKTPIRLLSLGVRAELEQAILSAQKDFKATLFIENLQMKQIENAPYEIYTVELNLDENA